jgi:hypothetical protein
MSLTVLRTNHSPMKKMMGATHMNPISNWKGFKEMMNWLVARPLASMTVMPIP